MPIVGTEFRLQLAEAQKTGPRPGLSTAAEIHGVVINRQTSASSGRVLDTFIRRHISNHYRDQFTIPTFPPATYWIINQWTPNELLEIKSIVHLSTQYLGSFNHVRTPPTTSSPLIIVEIGWLTSQQDKKGEEKQR